MHDGDMDDDDINVTLEVTITSSEGPTIELINPMLGDRPYVLILPRYEQATNTAVISVRACDIPIPDLAQLFGTLSRELAEQEAAGTIL